MQTRLLIVCEDEERLRHLSDVITLEADSDLAVFTTCSVANLHADTISVEPDVLLIDHAALADRAQQALPLASNHATRIVFLCESCPSDLMLSFVRLGACGCVAYSAPGAHIVKAVQSVHSGEVWFGRSSLLLAVRGVVEKMPVIAPRHDDGRLTAREDEIFELIGQGLTNKEIARQLNISDHTVKTHLHRVYVKLQQSGRYKALLSQPGRVTH